MGTNDTGGPPGFAPGELDARVDGTCTLRIDDVQGGPPLDEYPLICDIRYSADRRTVWLLGFEPIVSPEHTAALGPLTVTNTTHVRLASAEPGGLDRDGHVSLPVVLHFDHLFDVPFYEEDSHLPLTLRSDAPGGTPLDADGRLTLVGDGHFRGGALDGKRCRLVYAGRVSPLPW
jgi:hypothetical protein